MATDGNDGIVLERKIFSKITFGRDYNVQEVEAPMAFFTFQQKIDHSFPFLNQATTLQREPTNTKPTISSRLFVEISPDNLVSKHVSRFVHALHQFFKYWPRCRDGTIRFHLRPQLQSGLSHGVVVSLEQLDSGAVQTTEPGHCKAVSEQFKCKKIIVRRQFAYLSNASYCMLA